MHFYVDEIMEVLKEIDSRLDDIEKLVNEYGNRSPQGMDYICRYNSINSHLWQILQDIKEI